MPKNLIPTAAALGLLLALPGLAAGEQALPRVSPEEAGLSRAMLERATERLERAVSEMEIAGAVGAVAREGRLAYLEAVGYQDIETRTPMDPASIFRIYSMTKTVTAVAVMMLHEEGAFELDEPVSRYLPAFSRVGVTSPSEGPRPPPLEADHDPGSPPPHLRAQPPDRRAVPRGARAVALDPACPLHREYRGDAPHGGSGDPLTATAHRPPCSALSSKCGPERDSTNSWRRGSSVPWECPTPGSGWSGPGSPPHDRLPVDRRRPPAAPDRGSAVYPRGPRSSRARSGSSRRCRTTPVRPDAPEWRRARRVRILEAETVATMTSNGASGRDPGAARRRDRMGVRQCECRSRGRCLAAPRLRRRVLARGECRDDVVDGSGGGSPDRHHVAEQPLESRNGEGRLQDARPRIDPALTGRAPASGRRR